MRAVDYDLVKASERGAELHKIAEAKEFDLRRTADVLESSSHELARLKDDHQRIQADNIAI